MCAKSPLERMKDTALALGIYDHHLDGAREHDHEDFRYVVAEIIEKIVERLHEVR